jgi:hypothetical protein
VSDDDLFFVSRNGQIWACWLSGKPAVNLGSEAEVLSAMAQIVGSATAPLAKSASPSQPAAAAPVASTPPASPPPPREIKERDTPRHELTIIGRVFTVGGSRDVTILDLSESGCQFYDASRRLENGARLTIKIGPVGPIEATVRWRRGDNVGVKFNTPLYPSVLEHIRDHFDLRRQ